MRYTLNGQPLAYGGLVDADGVGHPAMVLELWSDQELARIGVVRTADPAPSVAELAAALVGDVNAERDRRISGGFALNGKTFQTRQSDRENISTMGVQAQLAVLGGAQVGDLHWHGDPDNAFRWITGDNTTVELDAQGMVELFERGVTFKSALTFTARAKKDWLLNPTRTREELAAFDVAADWPQ